MNPPSIYIVILNWNGLEDTLECIASVMALSAPGITTVVVDNASKDGQAESISEQHPTVVVLPQTENLGFCGGCNVGIEYAIEHGADHVMLLNNDTLIPPDLIEELLSGMENLENVAAVSPVILEHPDTAKVWYSGARWDTAEAQFRLSTPGERYGDTSTRGAYETEFACGCCMLIPVPVLEKVGLLDERYFAFYDEAAWCARARRDGLRSYVIPSAFMYHKVSRSTPALVSTYLLTRNRLLWMKENLKLRVRLQSLSYLARELVWHLANLGNLTSGSFSKSHSRAVVLGYKHYFEKKLGRWDKSIDRLLFP